MSGANTGNVKCDSFEQPKFGVAGFPPNFFESAFGKKRENIFAWLKDIGLDWIELQCTRGVKMKPDQARLYSDLAEQNGIGISIHGPYFISLASGDPEVVERSRYRILQCFELAELINSKRIIFHPGYYPGDTPQAREAAIRRIINELNMLKPDVPKDISIYPETAGKNSQIGSVEEILNICEHVEYARPCIDLAHVHAFEHGALRAKNNISDILSLVGDRLGSQSLNNLHIHMYPVDYNSHGEKKHKAFDDIKEETEQFSLFYKSCDEFFFPRAEHFVLSIKEMGISPVVICEAYNTQDVGALLMKKLYGDHKQEDLN